MPDFAYLFTPVTIGARQIKNRICCSAHADALEYLVDTGRNLTVNLGTGRGVSVLELVQTFERVTGRRVPYEIVARRPGDVASVYADPSMAYS